MVRQKHFKAISALAAAALLVGAGAAATVKKSRITTKVLTIAGPQGQLAGTLNDAGTTTPLVLIIPGSGPTDRDGNNPLGVTAAPYRLLAEALAKQGVSTFRADKRGMFGSKAAIADANKVKIADYATDAQNWISELKKQTKRKCVWLAGHSEGGLVALVAGQNGANICGIITIAGPGRKLGTVMREQFEKNPANAPVLPDALRALSELEAGRTVDVSKMHPALQGIFNPAVQPFLIDMFSYDPADVATKTKLPMMIISGGRDLQVTAADAEALSKANSKAKLVTLADMNHVLKAVSANGAAANFATYSDPSLPIHPELVGAITAFVNPTKKK